MMGVIVPGMAYGNLYQELDDAQPIGRARLLSLYGHCYPGLQLGKWYRVLPGGGPYGVYLDQEDRPRFVSGSHVEFDRL